MMSGFVIARSFKKALKQTGITLLTAAGLAAGAALQDPGTMGPIWSQVGLVAPIALIALSVLGQTIVDAIKHWHQ